MPSSPDEVLPQGRSGPTSDIYVWYTIVDEEFTLISTKVAQHILTVWAYSPSRTHRGSFSSGAQIAPVKSPHVWDPFAGILTVSWFYPTSNFVVICTEVLQFNWIWIGENFHWCWLTTDSSKIIHFNYTSDRNDWKPKPLLLSGDGYRLARHRLPRTKTGHFKRHI